jgi:hypothetical protein
MSQLQPIQAEANLRPMTLTGVHVMNVQRWTVRGGGPKPVLKGVHLGKHPPNPVDHVDGAVNEPST